MSYLNKTCIHSIINIIVILAFLCSNIVCVEGSFDYCLSNKLSPSTNLLVLYKDFAIDDIALEVLQTLATSEDFPDIKVFYGQGVERDLGNKAGEVRCFGMWDMSNSKGKWAFYKKTGQPTNGLTG